MRHWHVRLEPGVGLLQGGRRELVEPVEGNGADHGGGLDEPLGGDDARDPPPVKGDRPRRRARR